MRRPLIPAAVVLAALLGLVIAAPASAATTGIICGQVTAFVPPSATPGSVTITANGTTTTEVIAVGAAIDATALATLALIADADATTCLDITADTDAAIVALDIAAQARICGTAALDAVTGVHSIAGVALPLGIVSADADLDAYLDAAAAADATVCADVTTDGTSGLIATVSLDATLNVCGEAVLDADSAALGGVDVPLSLLDAEAEAALLLAADANAAVCVSLVVDDTTLVQANLSASIDLCGEVTFDASADAVLDGVVLDGALLDASAAALLALTAETDGVACATVDVESTGGDTSISVAVAIEICAEVTAVTDGTVTLGGVTFTMAGAADAGIEIGDELCITAAVGPNGTPIIVDSDVQAGSGNNPGPMLPDTATGQPVSAGLLGSFLLAAGLGLLVVARTERSRR